MAEFWIAPRPPSRWSRLRDAITSRLRPNRDRFVGWEEVGYIVDEAIALHDAQRPRVDEPEVSVRSWPEGMLNVLPAPRPPDFRWPGREEIDAFKKAWRGPDGHRSFDARVEAGLRAVYELAREQATTAMEQGIWPYTFHAGLPDDEKGCPK